MSMGPDTVQSWLSRNLTPSVIISIGTIVVGISIGWANLQSATRENEAWKDSKDKQISDIYARISPIDGLSYRVGQVEGSITSINTRIDRAVDNISTQLTELRKDVNSISTSIAVMARAVESRTGQPNLMQGYDYDPAPRNEPLRSPPRRPH